MNDKIKILYVDDNPLDRALVQDSLEKEHGGFIITEAKSRKEFELIIVEQKFDLVITDFNILGYEGLQVLETVQQKQPGVPVIIVTGTGSEEVAAESIKRGAADYVIKSPQHILRLPQTIKSVFELEAAKSEKEHKTEELVESEERYRQLVEHSPEAIVIHQNGIVVFANSSAFELMKDETQQKFIGENISNIIHPDDWSRAAQRMEKMLAGENQESTVEYRIKNYDDNYIYLEVSSSPIKYKGDVAIQLIARDITDRKIRELEERKNKNANINLIEDLSIEINRRKEAEEKLIENQFLLSKAQNIGNIGSWEIDIKTNIIKWTSQTYKIFEFPESEEINYEKFLSSIHPDDRDYVNEKWLEGINNRSYDIEHRILVNGKVKWVREKADFEFDSEENPTKAIGFAQDITEQKNAVQAVNEARGELEKTELIAKMGGWSIDMKTMATYLSKGVREIYEIEPDYNLPVEEGIKFYAPEHRPLIENAVRECMQTGKPYELDLKLITAKGNMRWVHTSGTAEIKNETIIKISGFIQDITDRKKYEEEILELNRTLTLSQQIAKLGYWSFDVKTMMPKWSDEIFKMYGIPKEEGEPSYIDQKKLVHPDDWEYYDYSVQNFINNEIPYDIQYRVVHKNGNIVWLRSTGICKKDEKDKVTELYGIALDITSIKKQEEEIKVNLTKFKTLFDTMPAGITVTDNSGKIVESNFIAEKLLGLGKTDHEKRKIDGEEWKIIRLDGSIMPSDEFASVRALKENKTIHNVEMGIVKGNSEITWITVTAAPIPLENYGVVITYFDITDRINADKLLIESEKQLRESQKIARLGSYSWSISDGLWKSSDILDEIFGIDENYERSFEGWTNIIHPEWQEIMAEYVSEEVIGKRKKFDKEYKIIRQFDGKERWVHGLGELEFDEKNQPVKLFGNIRDITEHKNAEETLKESEENYRNIVDWAPVGIYKSDKEGNILLANNQLAEILGYKSHEAILNVDISELYFSPETRSELIRKYDLHGKSFAKNVEVLWKKKNGNPIWIALSAHAVKNDDGTTKFYEGFVTDITERKKAELALQESELKFRNIFENAQVGIFRTSAEDGTLLMANQRTAEIFGYKTIDAARRYYKLSEHYVDPNIREKLVRETKQKGYVDNFEAVLTNRLNEPRWIKYSVHYRKDGDYFEGVVEDINEEKILQQKYETMVNHFPNGVIFLFDKESKYTFVGGAALETEGIKVNDLVGKQPNEVWPKDLAKKVLSENKKILKGEQIFYETTFNDHIYANWGIPIYTGKEISEGLVYALDITELKQRNEFIQTVMDNLPLGVALNYIDEAKVFYINEQFEKIYGWTKEDFPDIPTFFQKVYQSDAYREKITKQIMNDIQSGDPSRMHWENLEVTHKDGSIHFVDAQNIPLPQQNTMVSTVVDVTEQRNAEMKLIESEQHYRHLFDHSPVALWDEDYSLAKSELEKLKKRGVKRFEEYLDRKPKLFKKLLRLVHINNISNSVLELYEADSKEQLITKLNKSVEVIRTMKLFKRALTAIYKGERKFIGESSITTLKGNQKYISLIWEVAKGFEDDFSRIYVSEIDITERKKAEIALRESEERYKSLVESAPDPIAIHINGKLVFINTAGVKLLEAKSAEELIGMSLSKIIHPDYIDDVRERVKKILSGEESYDLIEEKYVSLKGKEIPVEVTAVKILFKNQNAIQVIVRDISERKRAIELLKESESRTRAIFEHSLVGIILSDPKGNILEANDALIKMLGSPSVEATKQINLLKFKPLVDMGFSAKLKNTLKNNEITSGEDFYITKWGKQLRLRYSFVPIKEESGSDKVLGTIEDVTELRAVEKALRESEEKYRMLVENQTDLIVRVDTEGRFEFVSRSYSELFEIPEDKLLGKKFTPLVHKDDREHTNEQMKKLYKPPYKCYLEQRAKTKKGWRWIGWSDKAVLDEESNVTSIIGVGRDITDRKKAELEVIEERNRAEIYLESSAVLMLALDMDGTVSMVNSKGAEMLGYSKKYIIGKNWFDNFIPNENKTKIKQIFKQAMRGSMNESEYFENPVLCRYNRIKIFGWHNNFIKDEKGNITGVLASAEDITESIQLRNQIQETNEKLQQLTKHMQDLREQERSNLAREIHDDLGQALTALKLDMSSARKLNEKEEVESKLRSAIDLTNTTIKTVQEITSELRPGLIDDLGLITTFEWYTEQFSERANLKLDLSIEVEESDIVESHKIVFYRILQESLTNIIRHAKATKAKVRLTKTEQNLLLTIFDNGKGISEEDIRKVDSFGLMSMNERARSIEGTIEISGKEGKGTKVKLSVPLNNSKNKS